MEMLAHASWTLRIRHFLLNVLAFGLCYQTSNTLAARNNVTRDVAMAFDTHIPFLEWMIIPYLCSSVFFIGCFLRVDTRDELRVLSQRMLLATVTASLIFIFFPLRFSIARPDIASPLLAKLFGLLSVFDRPYNQLPSLHIAYCMIFWQCLSAYYKTHAAKLFLAACLMLVAVSTLFTYQHHLLDIAAGALLGGSVIALIQPRRMQINVAFYYAVIAIIVFITGVTFYHSWLAAYLSISLLLVCFAYQRRNRNFLHKKNGRHSLITRIIYAPYLIGYWLTWRMVQYKERDHPAVRPFSKQLWVGRRLSIEQSQQLPNNCVIIDLSAELSELKALRKNDYWHFPLLDLIEPEASVMEAIAVCVQNEIVKGRNVYLHCAMGYQRCIAVAEFTAARAKV